MRLTRFAAPSAWTSQGASMVVGPDAMAETLRCAALWPGGLSVPEAERRLPAWSFARLLDDARVIARDHAVSEAGTCSRVLGVGGLIVEYVDEPAVNAERLSRWWAGYRFVAYSTAFHALAQGDKPEGARWRLLVPFDREATLPEAIELAKWARNPRRKVGIVHADTERVWRTVAEPAMNPGGYRFAEGFGEPIAVDEALREHAAWCGIERRHEAEDRLGDGSMSKAIARFARHLRSRVGAFAWSRDDAFAGMQDVGASLWPGRVAVVTGLPGRGLTAFAVQVAEANARAGRPVLLCGMHNGTEEFVARLLTQRGSEYDPRRSLEPGRRLPQDVVAHLQGIVRDLPTLGFFTPSIQERTAQELAARSQAVSDLAGGGPPLLVMDALDGWTCAEELGRMVFDIARPGGLGPLWPGAAVLAVHASAGIGHDAFTSCEDLTHAADDDAEALVPIDPVSREASLVVALTTDPWCGDGPRPALLRVLRNGDGAPTTVPLEFRPRLGAFTAAAVKAPPPPPPPVPQP